MIRPALLLALLTVVGCGTIDAAPGKTDGAGDGAGAVGATSGTGAIAGMAAAGGAGGAGGALEQRPDASADGQGQPKKVIPDCIQQATTAACDGCRVDSTNLSALCAEGLRCMQTDATAWQIAQSTTVDPVTNCSTSQPVQACLHALVAAFCP